MRMRKVLPEAIAICAPLAVLAGVHVLFAPPPPQPDASGGPAAVVPTGLVQAATAKLSPEQEKAADWVKSLAADAKLVSPLDHPVAATVAVAAAVQPEGEATAPEPEPEPDVPTPQPLAGLKLTAVMGNAQGGLALINRKVYKIGDAVRPGVTITGIDVKHNLVRFKLEDGSVAQLKREQRNWEY